MNKNERCQILFQYVIAITVAAYTAGGFGTQLSWSSPALEYFKSNNTDFPIPNNGISWIAPLFPTGLTIGYLLTPIIINRFDRKLILLIFALPQIISWILIIFAKNVLSIYIARILGGIGYAGGSSTLVVFLSEISKKKSRGIFLTFLKLFLSLGIFFIMLLSSYLTYNYMNFTILATMSFFVFAFIFMPNSSYFREEDDQRVEKIKMLKFLEFREIKENSNPKSVLKEATIEKEKKVFFNFKIKESSLWKILTIEANRRAVIIVIFCAAQDVFSGHVVVRYFAYQIFTYNSSFLTPEKASLLLASIKVVAALICIQVIERVRRKVLLLFTGLFGSLGLGVVGLFFFLENFNVDISMITWFPLFGVCLYDFMLTIGIGNFIYLYPGELFPNDLKGLAITFCKVMYGIFSFFSILKYQILVDLVNTYVIFCDFALTNIILSLIILKITPETRGMGIEEIQILLKSQKFF